MTRTKGTALSKATVIREYKYHKKMMELYEEMYEIIRKAEDVRDSDKWGFLFTMEKCPEYGTTKYLPFCLEKCTIKCKDFSYVEKYPKFIAWVKRLNRNYWELLKKIEETKRD